MNAVRADFPGTEIFGCFFHLVRSIKRQLAEQRLLARCRSDSTFQHAVRMIVALAYVPPAIVQTTFDSSQLSLLTNRRGVRKDLKIDSPVFARSYS
uniref:MULE transposase domain-containing protein n=1 Tax=Trichuris muris TaxID=70415 RepID=A0A5S6QA25_TRIMR